MDFAAYSVVFDFLSAPVLVTGRDGKIVYVNPAYERLSGYRSGELLGEKPSILRSGETPDAVYQDLWERIASGGIWRGRFRNLRKDGKPFHVSAVIAPIRNQGGEITELVSVQENLDARPRGDSLGIEEAALLHEVANHVPGVILQFRLYPDGRAAVPFASGSIVEFFDCTAAEVRQNAQALLQRIHKEDLPRLLRSLIGSAKHSREWSAEFRVLLSDGDLRWYSIKAMPEQLADGSWLLHGYIGDVTQRKEAEEELERYAESMRAQNAILERAQYEAGQASRAKSQFLANVGHEFRTPMNGVLGAASLLRDTDTSEEQKEYLGILQSAAESLVRVIEGILDFSRLESRRTRLVETAFRPHELFFDVADVIDRSARRKGLHFRAQVQPSIYGVAHGDPNVLKHILLNVGSNAVKFTEQGRIVMRLERSCEDDEAGRTFFEFVISDTGPGIPEEKRELIFQPFTQVDDSATRTHGGTGMGLAICRELVRQMGGEVIVESCLGRGSAFRVRVPLRFKPEMDSEAFALTAVVPANEDKSALLGDELPALHILIVEDDPATRRLAQRALSDTPFIVDCVPDGADALLALAEADFDLVLMDCHLPRIDGLEATRQVRNGEVAVRNRDVPIFALASPEADASARERCLEAGMNEVLSKPLDPLLLIRLAGRYVGRA